MSDLDDLMKLLSGLKAKKTCKEDLGIDLPDAEFIKSNLMESLSAKAYFTLLHNANSLEECVLKCAGRLLMASELKIRECPVEMFEKDCKEMIFFLKGMKENIEKAKKANLHEKTALLDRLNEAD